MDKRLKIVRSKGPIEVMSKNGGHAGAIREFICNSYIKPAKVGGEAQIIIESGDVHRRMGLSNLMPDVCQVLRGQKLQNLCNVRLLEEKRRPGVKQDSSTNRFVFEL